MGFRNSIIIGFMTIRGQSRLNTDKQIQIEDFLKKYKCDILNLQETDIQPETFSTCKYTSSNYNILANNSTTNYGTSSLVKSEFVVENIKYDSDGRVMIFDIDHMTFGNMYFNSGTDSIARRGRDKLCSEVLPNI